MTTLNTDQVTDMGKRPYSTDFHDEFEIDLHCAEGYDANLGSKEEWAARHHDRTLDFYCDNHPSAPECKVYDD